MRSLEFIPIDALTPNMRMLRERYGFDTLAACQDCVDLARLPPLSCVLDVGDLPVTRWFYAPTDGVEPVLGGLQAGGIEVAAKAFEMLRKVQG